MTKSKVSDEQIIEKLQDPIFTSYRQIAIDLGITPSGDFNNRCRQLSKKNGLPEKEQKKREEKTRRGHTTQSGTRCG